MNLKTWLLLLVALLTGGAAALGVKSIFFVESDEGVEEVAVAVGTETQVLVANVDIPAGVELTAQNVRLTLTPESEIPREERPLTFSEAVGALTVRDLKAGEPISLFDVAAPENLTASEEIYVKPGYAIVPIEIQTATKAGGGRDFLKTTKLDKMLKPGDVVDLAVVKEDKSVSSSTLGSVPRRRLTTETIVEGVEVFSVSDASRFSQETGAAERASTVSVQLSQEQLTAALKAAEQGRVKIIPRVEQTEFETGSSDAPLALDGALNGGAFEPPMNADFSFSGLTEETTVPENVAPTGTAIAADVAPTNEPTVAAPSSPASDALVPFEIAVDEAAPEAETESKSVSSSPASDALVPFEIAVDEAAPEAENDVEKATPFRLRNASVRSENVEETEEETADEETPNGAAVPVAPNAEPRPRQASVAPSPNAPTYRESAVEAGVADKANVETAPNGSAKNFKYVSPFVTVNKKKSSASVAPSGRLGAVAR
ncbi:MAG: hypothetical protein IJO06_15340 [Thermoguttaceae bacterium]|nr:hypothetical protein [Thermoguttaceae bacterium]